MTTYYTSNRHRPDWIISGEFKNDKETIKNLRKVLRKWLRDPKSFVLIIG